MEKEREKKELVSDPCVEQLPANGRGGGKGGKGGAREGEKKSTINLRGTNREKCLQFFF